MKKTIWYGSNACDFCGKNCGEILYDGKTKFGPWATMCQKCFHENGTGVGLGKGQKYKFNLSTKNYEKVSG